MANLDSTLGAEQMESTTAGKCVSPTSWSVLAFGIQLNKMPFFPWKRYKQFFEKPLTVVIGGFALQYFCNDLNGAVQRQGYGVITFIPYIVMFSIIFALSVFWWIIYGRRLEPCQGLETLPRHRQDIQMNETQQPTQEIQRNETPQAGDVQMDQALQGFFIRREEFCSLMDCWFSTRLGEMTRDEALGKMKQLVEIGNRRSRDISIESTADETRAVMNESLETRGDGSRRLLAGSIVDGTHNRAFPVLCTRAAKSNSQARSLSHDGLVLKIPQNVNVGELGEIYDANLHGCRELHRRIEIGPKDGPIIWGSLRMAWTLDKDSTIQLGSFAIFKYTDSGVKCWMLQEGWTPTIFDIHRSSRNFFEVLTGERATWTVRGVNLRDATLRVATAEKSENLTKSHQFKAENGVDVVLFKEPPSLPMFLDGVFISASNTVNVEEGVPLKLHSQAIKVQRAFWISVVDAFIPRPWTVGIMTILSLLFDYFVAWHFAIVLPIIVATCVYLLHDLVPQQGIHVLIGGLAPLVEEFSNVTDSNSRTLSEGKLAEIDTPIGQKGGPDDDEDKGSTPPLEDSSSNSNSSTTTHDAKMGIGTLKTESITNPLRQAPVKEKKRRKRPSKKPPTQIIEACPDQFRASVQELTGMKPPISVPRGQPVVDNPLHTDLITPVTIGGLAPVVEEFSDVTNFNSRTIPEGKLAEMDMPMGKQGGDLPVGGSTPLLGDSASISESSSTTHGQDKSMKLDSSMEEQVIVVTDGDPLPAIQGLQIVGSAELGGRLTVCGQSINGTTVCMFQWVRHYPNGTVMYIEGAAQPEYTVTAEDHNTKLAVECVPMDERNRQGELMNVFANESKLITCGGDLPVGGSTPSLGDSDSASSTTTLGQDKSMKMDFPIESEQDEDGPLPGIQGLQIVGHAVLGGRLTVCGQSINGTTLCMFQWVRHYPNGTVMYIEGAAQPEYTVTADDQNTMLAVECVPMDERNRRGELVNVFANESKLITCGEMLQNEIDRYNAIGYASFDVKFLVDGSLPEEYWESTLTLMWNSYKLKRNNTAKTVVISEKYMSDVSIQILVGHLSQCVIKSHEGRSYYLEFPSSRSRDVGVLTFRLFQKTALDGKQGSGKKVATGNRQQTGESEESQCQTGDAKDEAFEVKRPLEHVSTNKNKYVPQVWKLPEFPKQDLTSPGSLRLKRISNLIPPRLSLAKGGVESRGGFTSSSKGVKTIGNRRSAHTEPTSQNDDAKEEVIELKNPQQHRATSKNKYVPQAHELSEPKEPTLMSRSGTGISDGDFPFEGRTHSAAAFSSIRARMSSQSAVVDDLTKTDEPIDKQPSRVSSPPAVEESFTTTDAAIDKQGGGLPDKKGKQKKNLTEVQVRLLKELKERGPTRTLDLAKIVGLVKGRDVNPAIYDLEKRNLVVKVNDVPPVWQLNEPGMNKTR